MFGRILIILLALLSTHVFASKYTIVEKFWNVEGQPMNDEELTEHIHKEAWKKGVEHGLASVFRRDFLFLNGVSVRLGVADVRLGDVSLPPQNKEKVWYTDEKVAVFQNSMTADQRKKEKEIILRVVQLLRERVSKGNTLNAGYRRDGHFYNNYIDIISPNQINRTDGRGCDLLLRQLKQVTQPFRPRRMD